MMIRLILLAAIVTLARPVLGQQTTDCVNPTSDLGVEFYVQGGVVVDGIAYFTSDDGGCVKTGIRCPDFHSVVAFDVHTLRKVRTYHFGQTYDSSPFLFQQRDGTWLVIAHEHKNQRTVAFQRDTAELEWTSADNQPGNYFFGYSSYRLHDGKQLILMACRNGLHAMSGETGEEVWWLNEKSTGGVTSCVDQEHGWIFYQCNGKVLKVRATDGEVLQSVSVATPSVYISEDKGELPYRSSEVVTSLTIDPERISIGNGDNWPITWADDGNQYTVYCDGEGFGGGSGKDSMSLARIVGDPPNLKGDNLASPTGHKTGGGPKGRKASGLLMVDGVLYMWVRNLNDDGTGSSLAWSEDQAKTWTWADWNFPNIGYPTWLNAGRNYGDAQDGFAYFYSPDTSSAYKTTDHMILARVPISEIRNRKAVKDKIPHIDIALIRYGHNDQKQCEPVDFKRYFENFCDLLAKDYPGVQVMLETNTWVDPKHHAADPETSVRLNERMNAVWDFVRQVAKERKYPLVEIYERKKKETQTGNWDQRIRNQQLSMEKFGRRVLDGSKDDEMKNVPGWFYDNHPNANGVQIIADEEFKVMTRRWPERLPQVR